MSEPGDTGTAELTAYEAKQVGQIAVWKSEPPNPLAEIFKRITLPGARVIGKLVPHAVVRASIDRAYELSEVIAGQADVRRQAGIHDLGEMRGKPLEECDRLAGRVSAGSQAVSVIEGAATGVGGPLTTLLDIPLLFVLAVRTVLKIGHCYGYPLDRPGDRRYVLAVLLAATSGTLATRQERLARLRDIEDWLGDEVEQDIVAEEVASFVFQLELFEEVPGVGAASGALLNLWFIRRVDATARRVFQERWLVDNGKLDGVEPAAAPDRARAPGWSGALTRAAYSGCYYLGFSAALPALFVASWFRPPAGPLARGAHDGAAAARDGVDRLLKRAGRLSGSPAAAESGAPALAPA